MLQRSVSNPDERPMTPEIFSIGSLPIHCSYYPSDPGDPLVLFLPGIATHGGLYGTFLSALARRGFNVVAIDPRGHGLSGGARGHYTVAETVADVRAVLDHCSDRVSGPVALMGYSIGSPLALAVAEAEPGVSALLCHTMLLGGQPPDWLHALGWQALGVTSAWLPGWRVDLRHMLDIDSLLNQARHARWLRDDELLVWSYPLSTLASVFGHRHRAFDETLPFRAAVMTGDRDEVVPISYTRRLVSRLTHDFEAVEVAGGGHMLPFTDGETLADHSAEWLHGALGTA